MKHPSGEIIKLHKKYFRYYIPGADYKFASFTKVINNYFPKFERRKIAKKYAKKHGLNWKAVEAEWIKAGEESSARGNKYHKFAENVYKKYKQSKEIKHNDKVAGMIKDKLLSIYSEYEPYPPEYIVGSLDLEVAGMVDLLFGRKRTLLIADWKFVKKLHKTNMWEKAFFPIQHMDSCNYYKYCLQVNLASYLIRREKYFPQYSSHKMALYHVTEDSIKDIVVPNLQQDVRNMLINWEKKKECLKKT